MLGLVFAMRPEQKHARQAGTLTELTLPHALRAEIRRLTEDTRRLRAERDELLGVLTQLARLLDPPTSVSRR